MSTPQASCYCDGHGEARTTVHVKGGTSWCIHYPKPAPRADAEAVLAGHVELLAEILANREAGSFDTCAGNADEDLEYAIEEVRDAIPPALRCLKEPK